MRRSQGRETISLEIYDSNRRGRSTRHNEFFYRIANVDLIDFFRDTNQRETKREFFNNDKQKAKVIEIVGRKRI